ncbi:MAG: acyl-ACP--UDP-N-acetylglucosamine O-acyltransferase [Alphaproteobacteria bacterium]|nr:acyl-ACP--UDP-N-acetylglucosamine O-acyltransferase [Alphaproteobacteria bacterium]
MSSIHPTSIIEKGAQIDPGATIGPYCVIGPHVVIEAGVVLKSHVVIEGHTSIGENTIVYPFASLGSPPQDLKFAGEESRLVIGKNNTIREHVTMNPGTAGGNLETRIGNNGLFMASAHVAHDCVLGDHVIMANNAALGGHVTLGDNVIIGGLSAVHQFVRIGAHAIIGGMSGVDSDVIPYARVKGERAHLAGLNLIGLERRGFSRDHIRTLQKAYEALFEAGGTMDSRIEEVARTYGQDDTVSAILDFARGKSRFPLCQPPRR